MYFYISCCSQYVAVGTLQSRTFAPTTLATAESELYASPTSSRPPTRRARPKRSPTNLPKAERFRIAAMTSTSVFLHRAASVMLSTTPTCLSTSPRILESPGLHHGMREIGWTMPWAWRQFGRTRGRGDESNARSRGVQGHGRWNTSILQRFKTLQALGPQDSRKVAIRS